MRHNGVLWAAQWVLGLYFLGVGVSHFVIPDGLPQFMGWFYELDISLHRAAGAAEILGGLGLILPSVTRIRPRLTILAAIGLVLVMLGAIVWHVPREEWASIGTNAVNIIILGYIAYGRSRLAPLEP